MALAGDRDRRLEMVEGADAETAAQKEQEMMADVTEKIEDYEFVKGAADATYFNKVFATIEVTEESIPVEGGGQSSARGANRTPEKEKEVIDEELREIENKYKMLKVIATKFLQAPEWSNMIKNLL